MRLLLIHAQELKYRVTKRVKIPLQEQEEVKKEWKSFSNTLVAFLAVEKKDEKNPEIAQTASEEIIKVYNSVKASSIVLYPYAHLSSSLASPGFAVDTLQEMRVLLQNKYEVDLAPFGWYKEFVLHCYGHPLSELSREL
jgi:threonyl-tRNA synthetase